MDLAEVATVANVDPHPLLLDRPVKKNVLVLALSSDRGLCGALNSSVVRMTQRFIVDHEEDFESDDDFVYRQKGF